MIRVALIGAGSHSLSCHAPALQRYAGQNPGKAVLAAACDLDLTKAGRAAEQFGFARACGSIDELFAPGRPRVDAVIAVTPIDTTLSITRRLLKEGVPLLIEKPLGRSIEEARAIHAAVEIAHAGERVMVSLNRRYDPSLLTGLAWARRQGPTRYVRGTMVRSGRTEPDFVWGTGIHLIDALWQVSGPLKLREQAAGCPARGGNSVDCWRTAALDGKDGAMVWLEILPTAGRPWIEHIRLFGDEYCVEIQTGTAPPGLVRAYRSGHLEIDVAGSPDEPGFVSNGTYGETEAFLDAVAEGRPVPPPRVSDALASGELAARLQDWQ